MANSSIEACIANGRLSGAGTGIRPRLRANPVRTANISCAGINKGLFGSGIGIGALAVIPHNVLAFGPHGEARPPGG